MEAENPISRSNRLAISFSGYRFEPKNPKWKLSHEINLNILSAAQFLQPNLQKNYLKVIRYYAENYSAGYVCNIYHRFKAFILFTHEKQGVLNSIRLIDVIIYRASLVPEKQFYMASLRCFFKSWAELGYSGVDGDVPVIMTRWKVPHCVKGRAVRTLCPISGPLSDLEFEALHQATITAFETNEISPEDFLLVALFMATGRRACQLADLKAKDLVEAQSGDGLREFLLNVPRRKQPGIKWRELFRAVALIPEIGCVIKTVIEQNRKAFLALFKDINPEALDELPIFPQWSTVRSYVKNAPENVPDALLLEQYFHYKSQFIGPRLKKRIASFNVPSERTGDKLFVFPTRLRRTLATRAAREGYGEYIIAELLDHTDTQCVGIYTENVPEHINSINEAVARQLTPYAWGIGRW
jgi:integrase